MIKKAIVCTVAAPFVLGLLAALLSFFHSNMVEVSAIYPEYGHLDSVYAPATGFPFPQWARNDPQITGVGAIKSVVLWRGILGNWIAYGVGILLLEIALAVIALLLFPVWRHVRKRKTANIPWDDTQ